MATLVASSKNYAWRNILVYQSPVNHAGNKFLDAIFTNARLVNASRRLKFVDGRRFYTPSEEYKEYFTRFKLMK